MGTQGIQWPEEQNTAENGHDRSNPACGRQSSSGRMRIRSGQDMEVKSNVPTEQLEIPCVLGHNHGPHLPAREND